MSTHSGLATLLGRTTLTQTFDQFLRLVEEEYPAIGQVTSFEPIVEGYEDANIKLITSSGEYVLKIFLKERHPQNVKDYIRALQEARAIGVPVPKLVTGSRGDLSFVGRHKTSYIITEFFDGENFDSHVPTLEDMLAITSYVATLNTLTFPYQSAYDSWGARNLLKEYDKNGDRLSSAQRRLIAPVLADMRRLDFSRFATAIIHGDVQRNHVLKNSRGEYCILDFGCMAHDAKVLDLAIHVAWFCLSEETWADRDAIVSSVIAKYSERHRLSKGELEALPILARASYAAYYLKTVVLIAAGDDSLETRAWYDAAEKMLGLTEGWQLASVKGRL